MPTRPVHLEALSGELVDPYGVAAGTQPNLKRLLAKRLLGRQKFTPRGGQYPHTQGLADLAETGLGLYAHHLANQEGYAKDDRIAQALMAQVKGGGIGQADMPQRQPREIQPFEDKMQTEMEPSGPDLPTMERMPPPQQTAGFDTSRYDPFFKKGPEGHRNLAMAERGYKQYMAEKEAYKTSTLRAKERKEDQIIAAQGRQDTLRQQQRQYDLSLEKFGATERSAERRHRQLMSSAKDRQQIAQERLDLSREGQTERERGNSLAEERIALNRIEVNIKNSNTVNEFKQKQFDDWGKDSKLFRSMQNRYIDFNNAIGQLNITGDYKAITEYLKMSDASLVSISEAEMVAKARSYPDLFRNFVDLVVMKEIALSPTQRKQLKTIAMNQWQAGVDSHKHSQDIAVLAHSKVGLPGQLTTTGKLGAQKYLAEKVLREGVVPSYARKDIKHVTDFASESDKKVQNYMKKFGIEDFGEAQKLMRGNKGKPPPQRKSPKVVRKETENLVTTGTAYDTLPKPTSAGQIAHSSDGDSMIAIPGEQGLLRWVDEGRLLETNPDLHKKYGGQVR